MVHNNTHTGPMERVHYVHIKAGDVGHSYETLFQKCLDGNVEWVEVQDPYIRARHQVLNMVRFCELLVKSCKKLREIRLMTGAGESHGGEVCMLYNSTVHAFLYVYSYNTNIILCGSTSQPF